FRRDGQLQIDPRLNRAQQYFNVALLNVAAVFAQMHGDLIGAAQFGFHGGPHRIGFDPAPGLAHGRNVIDVDAQFFPHHYFNNPPASAPVTLTVGSGPALTPRTCTRGGTEKRTWTGVGPSTTFAFLGCSHSL